MVKEAAGARPSHTALISPKRQVTWSELDKMVDGAARALLARGLTPGDRIALLAGNSVHFVVAYMGILRAGMVAMPMNPTYTATEVGEIFATSQPKLALAGRTGLRAAMGGAKKVSGLEVVDITSGDGAIFGGLSKPSRSTKAFPTVKPADLAVMLFTSGSEGKPKGVMLTHKALSSNVEALAKIKKPSACDPDDVVLMVLPLFHVYGLNAGLGLAVRKGATTVLMDRWDAKTSLALVKKHKVTNIAGAPLMYVAWSAEPNVREALTDVRLLVSGGAGLPSDVFASFLTLTGKQIWEGYGMTESGPVISSSVASGRAKPGCVGRPLRGISVSLRNEDGSEVDEGDPGELWIKSPSLFSGYWVAADAKPVPGTDANGWFHTGDVALIDEDGDLVLVDRRRDIVIVSGFNVFPAEVEAALKSLDEVAEAAVVGVPHGITGEAVKAFVVLNKGAKVGPDEIRAHAETRLARFKCPSIIEIVPKLPQGATGKVARGRLRGSHA